METAATSGVGFTVIEKLLTGPVQPLASGVTDSIAVTGAEVEFVAVKEAIFPVPEVARPIEDAVFVQV